MTPTVRATSEGTTVGPSFPSTVSPAPSAVGPHHRSQHQMPVAKPHSSLPVPPASTPALCHATNRSISHHLSLSALPGTAVHCMRCAAKGNHVDSGSASRPNVPTSPLVLCPSNVGPLGASDLPFTDITSWVVVRDRLIQMSFPTHYRHAPMPT